MKFTNCSDWQVYDLEGRRKYVTETERSRFLATADNLAPRIRTLCYVLAYTGCRVSEALSLKRNHIEEDRMVIVFRTLKARRVRFRAVHVPRHVIQMLLALPDTEDGRLLPQHRATAYRQVKQVMTQAKVHGMQTSPKGLRHGYGMLAASRSVPLNLLQRWMGHASGTTTAVYLDAVGAEERRFAERMW